MRVLHTWKVPFACALATVSLPLALIVITQTDNSADAAKKPAAFAPPPAGAKVVKAEPVEISLNDALGRNWLQAQYKSNGRNEIVASFVNRYTTPLRVSAPAGLIFETPDFLSQMVVARTQRTELAPGERRDVRLSAAATHSANSLREQTYHLCPDRLPILNALFATAEKSPEISRDAIQTAVLMINENLPLGAFAKFVLLSADPAAKPSPATFQVNTGEILAAFDLLKEAGYPRSSFTATHDSQLKIEAMIDPLSHAAAMQYYRIAADMEWTYWRDELQLGDLSTRHYALYGIGRYFPDVALQMLPQWARTKHLSALFRTSAVQALAETRRPEAISVLQSLVSEFGAASELGQSSRKAIAYLENQRNALPAPGMLVEFRLSQVDVR